MWAYDAVVRTVRRARRPDARQNAHRGSWYRCEATPPAWHPQLGFVVPLRTLACCRRRANEKSFRRYFDNDKAMFIFRTRGSHSINASVEELKPFTVKVHGDTQCASHCGLTRVPAYGRMDGWRNVMIAFSAASGGGLSKPVNPRCDTTVDEAATVPKLTVSSMAGGNGSCSPMGFSTVLTHPRQRQLRSSLQHAIIS